MAVGAGPSFATNKSGAVVKVVMYWALEQRVTGSNPGRVIVFACLGKLLKLDFLIPHRCVDGYLARA